MSWPSAASRCSVGTAKSGVPMKGRRGDMMVRPARGLRLFRGGLLRGLGEFLGDAVALQLGQVIDEQLAVEMVDLMLHACREQADRLLFMRLALDIHIAEPHGRRPFDRFVIFRNRQAALLVSRFL